MFRDFHGTWHADSAEIVPRYVNNHGEFSTVFGTAKERFAQGPIFFLCLAPAARPFDRSGLDVRAAHPQKHFGRTGAQFEFATVQISGVRRRRDFTKTAKQFPAVVRPIRAETMREIHLIDMAEADVLLRDSNHFNEILLRRGALNGA